MEVRDWIPPLRRYESWYKHRGFRPIAKVRRFIQRGKRGYADEDVWNLEYYLADVISASVMHLRHHNMAYPSDLTPEEWNATLEKISHGFKAAADFCDGGIPMETEPQMLSELDVAMDLFKKHFFNLWD